MSNQRRWIAAQTFKHVSSSQNGPSSHWTRRTFAEAHHPDVTQFSTQEGSAPTGVTPIIKSCGVSGDICTVHSCTPPRSSRVPRTVAFQTWNRSQMSRVRWRGRERQTQCNIEEENRNFECKATAREVEGRSVNRATDGGKGTLSLCSFLAMRPVESRQ